MKNNLRFIFPRLIGATLIVGLASFILFILFKLMVGFLLIGGVVAVIARSAGRRRHAMMAGSYGQFGHGGPSPLAYGNAWVTPITVDANPMRKETIVPIN